MASMEVFIGRIPPGVGVAEISDLLVPYGATNVRILDGKGCAFADFANADYGQRAIAELNGYQMPGGQQGGLNVKMATSKVRPGEMPSDWRPMPGAQGALGGLGAPQAPMGASQVQPQVFVGRLPANCEQRDLEELFAPYGAHTIKLLEGKNCAFASFDTWAAAEKAIADLDKTPMKADGNPEGINVKLADVKGAPKGAQQEPKVFIGGLAPTVTSDDVCRVCQQFGTITHSKIFTKNDKSMPCAFVTFSSFTEAELCINALSGKEELAAEGKTLVAKMADLAKSRSTMPMPPMPQMQAFAPAPMPMRAVPPPTMRGTATQPYSQAYQPQGTFQQQGFPQQGFQQQGFQQQGFQQQGFQQQGFQPHQQFQAFPAAPSGLVKAKGGDDPVPTSMGGGQGEKVFVGGLPEAVNMEFVWGMMAPFGQVADVKILRKQGASPCAFVRFAQPEDANQAVEMLESCRFTVKFADNKPGMQGQKRGFDEAFRPY
ncbi:CELF4 [Symbiodinium sp. CCMP2592]|nr:CELF4 [Symbiodinium sp. CCMP2592]